MFTQDDPQLTVQCVGRPQWLLKPRHVKHICMAETSRSFRWFRLPFEDDHFIHHDHIPFCTVELNRMQLVSQVQPDILIHALLMQHSGKQKLNQIIHIVYDVLQVNHFFLEVPGLCCFCCACIPAHPMIQWHIRHGLRLVPSSSMSLRVCVIKPLSSLLRPLGWPPPRSAHFELDGFDSSLGAIIDVYNLCDKGGQQLI